MTENQFGTLTDCELLELAEDLIDDYAELQNVKTEDMVKILSAADKSYRDRLTDYVQSAIDSYQDLTNGITAKDIATAAIDIAEAGSNSVLNNVINLLDIENAEHNND